MDKQGSWEKLLAAMQARDHLLLAACMNGAIVSVASIALMVVFVAMVGYMMQRRSGF